MANYTVEVEITVSADVTVEAESKAEALALVEEDLVYSALERDIGCTYDVNTQHLSSAVRVLGDEDE